jgi:AcrR family transcriptional regulator
MKATSIRARVRAEMTEEIKTIARAHLATDGANLSLRAVARDLGVVSSAIYRYFPSRDELLTALIVDAYNSLGGTVEERESTVDRQDHAGRFLAVCHAIRDWALARPHEYALIYGSPVPGYRAPTDTVAAAARSVSVLCRILQDAARAGVLVAGDDKPLPAEVEPEMARIGAQFCPAVPLPALSRGLAGWLQLFGAVSFELFGQFDNVFDQRDAFFAHQMGQLTAYLGLGRRRTG